MGFWAIICFVVTAIAIESGEVFMIITFGGIGILLTYLWATKDKRRQEEAERKRKEKEEAERKRKEETRQRALVRFNTSTFATQIIQDFRSRNWRDLDYKSGGCQIYSDKIITPCQSYVYIDYGWGKLDIKSCEELAEYLGIAYGKTYSAEAITKFVGGVSSSYSGHISSTGDVSVYRDAWGDDKVIGYKLYSKNTVPPPTPKGKAW